MSNKPRVSDVLINSDRLKTAITISGHSVKELGNSKEIDRSERSLSRYLKNGSMPIGLAEQIADYIGVDSYYFVEREDRLKTRTRLNWGELQETVRSIVEIFEDFLESKGITIDNPEKEENPYAANIYGMDFCYLQSQLELIFVDRGLVTQEIIDKFK